MSDFIFVGRAGGAMPLLQSRVSGLVAVLGYRAERVRTFESRDRSMAALQFCRATALYESEEQSHVDDAGRVTLLKGHLVRKDAEAARVLTAEEIGARIPRVGVSDFQPDLSGDFGVCHFDDEQAVFFCDLLSMVSIFYHVTTDGVCIVATRPRLIRELLDDWDFDFRNLAWQASAYWPIGNGTLLRDVRRIPQAGILGWDRMRGLKMRDFPLRFLWNHKSTELSKALDRDPVIVMDRVIARMGASLRAILHKAPKVSLAITGGRDSRAIAALVSMGNGRLDNLQMFTNGVPDHPDVVVGRMIAERMGVGFDNRIPGSASYSARKIMRQRLGAVFRYDGMLPFWDGGGDSGVSSQVLLQGHVGEVYRDKWFKGSFDSAAAFAKHMMASGSVDPNRLLRPEVASDFQGQLEERAAYYLDNGARSDQLGGVFRIEGMQSWESSQYSQGALWASHPIHPLYDPEMIDISFAASAQWRDDERIHYEITKRSRVNLVDLPFAGYAWHKGLQDSAGCLSVGVEPIKNVKALVSATGWQAGLFFSSPLQRMFLEVFEECGASPLWDYYDRNKAISIIRTAPPDIGGNQMSRMYSLLTSLCHAHSYEIPVKFDSPAGHDSMEGRTILASGDGVRLLYDGKKSAEPLGEAEIDNSIPQMKVAAAVTRLLGEEEGSGDSEKDLYDLFGQLRQTTVEKRKLEREVASVAQVGKSIG